MYEIPNVELGEDSTEVVSMAAISRSSRVGGILLCMCVWVGSSQASMMSPTYEHFEFGGDARVALEQAACTPLKARLQASLGRRSIGSEESQAFVRCSPHAVLYGNPVVFERSCDYVYSWVCEAASEIVMARFPDREALIEAKGVSLAEAYEIVRHVVLGGSLRPPSLKHGMFGDSTADTCEVRAMGHEKLILECSREVRWVQKVKDKGVIRYRQIPSPQCAMKEVQAIVSELPECVREP